MYRPSQSPETPLAADLHELTVYLPRLLHSPCIMIYYTDTRVILLYQQEDPGEANINLFQYDFGGTVES